MYWCNVDSLPPSVASTSRLPANPTGGFFFRERDRWSLMLPRGYTHLN